MIVTMLWANSADNRLMTFFLFLLENRFDISWRQFERNVKSYFLGRRRKNISKCRLLNFFPSMQSVELNGTQSVELNGCTLKSKGPKMKLFASLFKGTSLQYRRTFFFPDYNNFSK